MYPILGQFGPFVVGSVKIGPIVFHSYGLFVALGILTGMLYLQRQLKKRKIDPDVAYNMGLLATIGGIIGARLFYVIGNYKDFAKEPLQILAVQSGGLVWFGGLFGACLLCAIYLRRTGLSLPLIADLTAPGIALGFAVGRIGCLLNGDDYGKPTSLPWGMAFPIGSPPVFVPVHPTQIYESLLGLVIFALLIKYRKKFSAEGSLFWFMFALFGVERFLMEFIRVNQIVFAGLTIYHFISIVMVAVSCWVLYSRYQISLRSEPVAEGASTVAVKRLRKKRK